jgi:hypothetical protein
MSQGFYLSASVSATESRLAVVIFWISGPIETREVSMSRIAFFVGGLAGAAQLTALWGLIPNLDQTRSMDAAGWILLTVPLGALLGVLASTVISKFKVSREGWVSFLGAWAIATICGFPAALIAPMFLVGLGPSSQGYRYLAFVVEYGLIWSVIYLVFRPKTPKQ